MYVDLDDLKLLAKIDPSNMVSAVDRFPDVFLRSRDEWDIVLKSRSSIQSVVLMGMGGSASAADVVLDWLKTALPVPALVHREPGLPAFVNARTLFIAMSYSFLVCVKELYDSAPNKILPVQSSV